MRIRNLHFRQLLCFFSFSRCLSLKEGLAWITFDFSNRFIKGKATDRYSDAFVEIVREKFEFRLFSANGKWQMVLVFSHNSNKCDQSIFKLYMCYVVKFQIKLRLIVEWMPENGGASYVLINGSWKARTKKVSGIQIIDSWTRLFVDVGVVGRNIRYYKNMPILLYCIYFIVEAFKCIKCIVQGSGKNVQKYFYFNCMIMILMIAA